MDKKSATLQQAASRGDLARVKELATASNLDSLDSEGRCALHLACFDARVEVAVWLCSAGADVNRGDRDGKTPLHFAANQGKRNAEIVRVMLAAGCKPDMVSRHGTIPLHHAAYAASKECLALLLKAAPHTLMAKDHQGRTALHNIANRGLFQTIYPLHLDGIAVPECCNFLLEAGSVVDELDDSGRSPLYWSFFTQRRDVSEVLLDHGAQICLVKLDRDLTAIPDWVDTFLRARAQCRRAALVICGLNRCNAAVRGNGRDALVLVAKCTWATRCNSFVWDGAFLRSQTEACALQ